MFDVERIASVLLVAGALTGTGRKPGVVVFIPGGIRSLQNPIAFGDPDHYSIRYTGPEDGGGVHINSGIANHACYLAIEGGTNRVNGGH